MLLSRVAEGLPHVHHREADALAPLGPEEVKEHREALFGTIAPTEPERLALFQVADHDTVDVAFADREFINADDRGRDRPRAGELFAHVELVHLLDRMPIEMEVGRHLLDRGAAALFPDVEREAFGVVRIGRQPVEALLPHAATGATRDAAYRDLEEDAQVATRQIAHAAQPPVVPGAVDRATRAARRFFARRVKVMTRAWSSPGRFTTTRLGTKPGKRYASRSSRGESAVRMQRTSAVPAGVRNPRFSDENRCSRGVETPRLYPHDSPKSPK